MNIKPLLEWHYANPAHSFVRDFCHDALNDGTMPKSPTRWFAYILTQGACTQAQYACILILSNTPHRVPEREYDVEAYKEWLRSWQLT